MRTLVELGVAPALVALSTLVARRWGSRAGGVVSAFPAIVGPVLLILALGHGRVFAARAANGTLLGLVALSAFALAYGWTAREHAWPLGLTCGWVAAGLAALLLGVAAPGAPSPFGLLVASLSLALARGLLPASRPPESPLPPTGPGRAASIPARMASAALLVAVLSTAAGALGAVLGGMLAALPVLACVLVVFTHRGQGAPAAVALLRGLLAGMASFVVFCQLIAVMIEPDGIAPAFLAATLAAVALQAIVIYPVHSRLRRHSSAPSPAVAAAAGALTEHS